jgi:hypothetical protein
MLLAFFMYENTTQDCPTLLTHIGNIPCNISCQEGEYVGLDNKNQSMCLACPENTYSTGNQTHYLNLEQYSNFLSISTQYCTSIIDNEAEPCKKWQATKEGIETASDILNTSNIILSHTVFMELVGNVCSYIAIIFISSVLSYYH